MAKSDPTKDHECKDIGDAATRIMERMVRMPPKPHKEMKLGKRKAKAIQKVAPAPPAQTKKF